LTEDVLINIKTELTKISPFIDCRLYSNADVAISDYAFSMLNMDLRLLRSFLAAADDQNICRAASNLHLTQSALSRRIKTFENELGVVLLDRGAHSFSLTSAGRMLHKHGPELLDHVAKLEEKIKAAACQQIIRVGYSPSLAAGLLAKAMQAFAGNHPRVRIELHDVTNKRMIADLCSKALDIALTVTPDIECEGILWQPIVQESWHVLISEKHPFCGQSVVMAESLAGQEIVIFDRTEYPAYWGRLQPWIRINKLAVKVSTECDGISSLTNAVEAGLGIAVVLERSIHGMTSHVISKPLVNGPETVAISVGVRRDSESDETILSFIESLKNTSRCSTRPD